MKSRRFKLASEGIPAGNRRENKGKKPRKESAGRRPEESGYLLITSVFPLKNQTLSANKSKFCQVLLAFLAFLDLTRSNGL
jgi:hypothetical protein